jgi:hypothetical protein
LHPHFRYATPASSCWTTSPWMVPPRGIEPRPPRLQRGVRPSHSSGIGCPGRTRTSVSTFRASRPPARRPGNGGAPDGTRTRFRRRDKPVPRRLRLRRRGRPWRHRTPDSGFGNRRDADFTNGLKRDDRNRTGIAGLEDQSSAVELHPGKTTTSDVGRRTDYAPTPRRRSRAGGKLEARSRKLGANFQTLARLSENGSPVPGL